MVTSQVRHETKYPTYQVYSSTIYDGVYQSQPGWRTVGSVRRRVCYTPSNKVATSSVDKADKSSGYCILAFLLRLVGRVGPQTTPTSQNLAYHQ